MDPPHVCIPVGVKCYLHKNDYFDKLVRILNYETHSFPLLFNCPYDQCSRMLRRHSRPYDCDYDKVTVNVSTDIQFTE